MMFKRFTERIVEKVDILRIIAF